MKQMRVFSLFLIFLVSFVTQAETYKNLPKLKSNQGYFVISYSGNYPPYHLSIASHNAFFLSIEDVSDFHSEKGYKIIALDEGEYKYSRLKLSKRSSYYQLRDNEFLFSVTAGKINYAGDLLFEYHHFNKAVSSSVVNHISKTYVWLKEHYPKLINKNKIIYSGLGEDEFMDFYLNQ
jgi:hypothetical protein